MNSYLLYHPDIPEFVLDYVKTLPMQRLRSIGMNCGCEYTSFPMFKNLNQYSRLDHSVGTAAVIWHFTFSKVQTLSGLFHDIATPVFAHVIDFLYGDYLKQETTERKTYDMISESEELQSFLLRDGIRNEDVCDYHMYCIADNQMPRLSADRLEYTFGNCLNFGICTEKTLKTIYEDLIVGKTFEDETELMFQTPETALLFAKSALRCSEIYVSDEDRYSMKILSEMIQNAMIQKVLDERDLYTTENEVIMKICSHPETIRDWEHFRSLHAVCRSSFSEVAAGGRIVFAKKRFIDPYVLGRGRVSHLFPDFAKDLNDFVSAKQDYRIYEVCNDEKE